MKAKVLIVVQGGMVTDVITTKDMDVLEYFKKSFIKFNFLSLYIIV